MITKKEIWNEKVMHRWLVVNLTAAWKRISNIVHISLPYSIIKRAYFVIKFNEKLLYMQNTPKKFMQITKRFQLL